MNTIVYYTKTHNTERFLEKVLQQKEVKTCQITKENKDSLILNEPYVLLTPTFGFGQVPIEVLTFLENNQELIKGVMASGNRNWGMKFANSGDIISEKYNTALIGKYELAGTKKDVNKLVTYMEELNE